MQLRSARMCLDCEEVHDRPECPACGSESFAYLSRWIPIESRRTPPPVEPTEQTEAYRRLLEIDAAPRNGWSTTRRWLTGGAFGIAALSTVGWLWRRRGAEDAPASQTTDKTAADS